MLWKHFCILLFFLHSFHSSLQTIIYFLCIIQLICAHTSKCKFIYTGWLLQNSFFTWCILEAISHQHIRAFQLFFMCLVFDWMEISYNLFYHIIIDEHFEFPHFYIYKQCCD